MELARKEKGAASNLRTVHPVPDGVVRVFSGREMYWPLYPAWYTSDVVATPDIAVDCEVEYRQASDPAGVFEPDANGPDLLAE